MCITIDCYISYCNIQNNIISTQIPNLVIFKRSNAYIYVTKTISLITFK